MQPQFPPAPPAPSPPPAPAPGRGLLRALPVTLVVLSAVLLVAAAAVAGVRLAGDSSSKKAAPAPSPTATTTPPSTPPAAADASGDPAYIRDIKAQVSELRGLAWKAPLAVQVVSKDELARRVKEVTARDTHPDRLAGDEATLKLLHLIPRDLDYAKAINDLLAEQVLGFYDPVTKDLVVADAGGSEVSPETRVSIAHELDHALTDQYFDFGGKSQALDDADQEEQYSAFTALIEGDAVNLQLKWSEKYLTADEQAKALLGSGSDTSVLDRTPQYLRDSLLFPYTTGVDFVAQLIKGKSFTGVDDAYGHPPTSTEQILHPALYTAGQGWTAPSLADVAAGSGCETVRKNTLGEFTVQELLDGTKNSARGWNGDVFQTVRCGTALGMADRLQTDSASDASRLEQALDKWAGGWSGSGKPATDGRFSGPDGSGRITRSGTQIDVVLADDTPTADRLEGAVGVLN